MQKYEAGISHISAGKLLLFSRLLNVPLNYFYEGLKLEENIGTRLQTNVIQKTRARPSRLLLIEDNPADVLLFRKALDKFTAPVDLQTSHDPDQALQTMQGARHGKTDQCPDVIIMDLSLPKRDGVEVLRLLKKNPKTLATPVIVLTNSINVKDMMDCYKSGAAGFIQKSVSLDDYLNSIATTLDYWLRTVVLPTAGIDSHTAAVK